MLLTLVTYTELFGVDIDKLKKLYQNETKNMVFGYGYDGEELYAEIPNSNNVLVVLPYKEQDGNVSMDDAYFLSLVLAVVDSKGEVLQSYLHRKMMISDGVSISNISIDTKTYSSLSPHQPFGVIVTVGARIYEGNKLFLYEPHKKSMKVLLKEYELSNNVYEGMATYTFRGYSDLMESKMKIACTSHNYCDIPVEHIYSRDYQLIFFDSSIGEEESTSTKLIYQNGKYQENKKVEPKFFKEYDVDTVLRATKEGHKYNDFEVTTLMFQLSHEDMTKNLAKLNNIAYYLQKNGQNIEAVIMLEFIVRKFPNRTVAYYNLGDAYWALGQKKIAKKMYKIYVKQMKSRGKGKKIPKVVKERVR